MNKKLNVLQIIDSLRAGGAEMMAVNIANGLAEEGVESHICATRMEGDLKLKVLPMVGYLFLNKKNTIDFIAFKKLYNYIIQNNIQVIHTHSSSYFLGFLIKVILPKIDLIWHDHYGKEENLDKRKSFPINIISKTFKSIISVNKLLKDWSAKNLKTKSVIYLPNFASFGNKTAKTTFLKGEEEKK